MDSLSTPCTANVVGATAILLLSCDEAQDVLISKWDKDFNPMAASNNATRVYWGTAWTSQTLLAREKRAALEAQKEDGQQRVFEITADDVRQEVPEYGDFVDAEIRKNGRDHPFVKTQYFCEEIDAEGGMFPPARQALMKGNHASLNSPEPGKFYAFLIDVAGEDEGVSPSPVSDVVGRRGIGTGGSGRNYSHPAHHQRARAYSDGGYEPHDCQDNTVWCDP